MPRAAIGVVLALFVLGCPPKEDKDKSAPATGATAACSRIGQSCEFAPGKLGTCVQRDDCPAGGSCFVCQSQH
ncbi:MAG TPA: hypothetical protein VIF62_02060 [Labilithrix sp.]|jgi:hypothetical protein